MGSYPRYRAAQFDWPVHLAFHNSLEPVMLPHRSETHEHFFMCVHGVKV